MFHIYTDTNILLGIVKLNYYSRKHYSQATIISNILILKIEKV